MRTYSPVFQQVGSQDNDAYRSQSRIQRMNKALKFHGDLFHTGVGYTVPNYRLHCYRFGKGMNWAPNMVSNTLFAQYLETEALKSTYS
ncbi:hypothetical protein PHMEG_00036787 [Phytophthora megakarya]|uniref:Uncharacterized protein n=1 Tax=Phytophthora megakarya TaxID=4795 RepID=A0A225UKI1_9STRA|nr:hypothetical protein PHMEG_00036787 [Phytophthora megakarya]